MKMYSEISSAFYETHKINNLNNFFDFTINYRNNMSLKGHFRDHLSLQILI